MSDALERRVIFRELLGTSSTFTNSPMEIILRRINVYILETEDVLFHHNSAVMMPSSPEGVSSEDGTEDDATDSSPFPGVDGTIQAGQEAVTGIRALGDSSLERGPAIQWGKCDPPVSFTRVRLGKRRSV